MTVDLTVIILNWNTRNDLRVCLGSIFEQQFRHSVDVVVADNASEDDSREMVRREFPQATLLEHPKNLGFCAGNNRAIPRNPGRYVLFLNADTRITPCAFDTLIDFADSTPDTGIIGPKLLNQDGSLQYSCRRFPNLGAGFFRNTPLGRLFPNNRFTVPRHWCDLTGAGPDFATGSSHGPARDDRARAQ